MNPLLRSRNMLTFLEAASARSLGQHEHAESLLEGLVGDELRDAGLDALMLTVQTWADSQEDVVALLAAVGMIAKERAARDIDVITQTYFEALDQLGSALLSPVAENGFVEVLYSVQPVADDERRALSNCVLIATQAIVSAHEGVRGNQPPVTTKQIFMTAGVNAHDMYVSTGGEGELPNFDNPASGPWSLEDL